MKRALVTSATSSIGQVITRTLARAGYELVLHYHSNQELAEQLAHECKATLVHADLGTQQGIESALHEIRASAKYDVVVNNAGVSRGNDDRKLDEWETIFRINTFFAALVMGYADELVNDGGSIINISSIYGDDRYGFIEMKAYDASKAAINSLTRTFAKQLAPRVRVNAIAPGFVDSRWNKDLSDGERQKLANEQLMQRFVTPQQVADLTMHIIQNEGLDAEIIYLDNGQTSKAVF